MATLIKFLLDPFNLIWMLLLASLAAYFLRREILFRWLILITTVWFLLVSTPLVPTALINSLEDRYDPAYAEDLENPDAEYHIIVLGGGHGFDDRLPPNSLLSGNALGRLNEGIRLHRLLPNSKLVLSGYSASGRTSQAEMLQKTALLLGVEEEATILQTEPGNTYEEAKIYADTFGDSYPVILVTSATHMPRAMMLFENFGVEPVASPANYRLRGSWKEKRFGLPSNGYISHMNSALYEYAAIYRSRFYDFGSPVP